ncbi:M50 family metallopeptidase [Brevibacterium album]|uniref:M50 family metallopeptidase n=1 Tax=Brevibacterium album TaxID=417948 RepID=UPI000406CB9E|nr:M50 family metallopeptidase [Brevibacterium album]
MPDALLPTLWSAVSQAAPHPDARTLIVAAVLAAALVIPHPVWRIAGVWVTVVHELGHAFAGMVRGRTGMRIRVNRDHSGLTTSTGHADTVAWTSFWGYPTPSLVGAAVACAAAAGWAGAALGVMLAAMLAALLFMRGVLTWAVTLATLAAGVLLLMRGTDVLVTGAVLATGMFLWAGGVRAIANVSRLHATGRGHGSDAQALAQRTPIPAFVWLAVFWLLSLAPVGLLVWALRA